MDWGDDADAPDVEEGATLQLAASDLRNRGAPPSASVVARGPRLIDQRPTAAGILTGVGVAGLQAILAGQQCMTVYKAVKKEADAASALAIALIKGQDTKTIVNGTVKDTVLNKDVPSALETPVAVTKANIKIVFDDGFQKASDVCTAAYASACQAAGIS